MYYNTISFEAYIQKYLFNQRYKIDYRESIISKSGRFRKLILKEIISNRAIGYARSLLLKIIGLLLISPLFGIKVKKTKTLKSKNKPVIYIANHESHLDAPAILSSLPFSIRSRIAVAAAEDHFFKTWIQFLLITTAVNIFPLTRRGYCRKNLEQMLSLLKSGQSILIFPEGSRTRSGKMNSFKKGVGYIIKEMNVSVIPIKVENSYEILPYRCKLPKKGEVLVKFGDEITFNDENICEITSILENSVKKL